MAKKRVSLMTAKEAAKYLHISQFTLAKIDEVVRPARTPGGHRRYKRSWLNKYLRDSQEKTI